MKINTGPENLTSLFNLPKWQANKKAAIKPPAHPWQDLALEIITQLGIPGFKRNSVFKICKEFPREYVMKCVNDTKELCKAGEQWKYFFKVVEANKTNNPQRNDRSIITASEYPPTNPERGRAIRNIAMKPTTNKIIGL